MAKALYLAKRGRPDILTAVAFLSTRVQNSTEQDMKKLNKLGKCLKDMLLTLGVEKPLVLHCYVDASYSVHRDGKSHSAGFTTLGCGAIRASSRKQTIVSKSSTEAEVVDMSDNTEDNLGIMYFLEDEGYKIKPMVLYQDNKSAMTFMDKGRSTSHRTRHIATRYFFIKDRVEQGDIKLGRVLATSLIATTGDRPLGRYTKVLMI